MQKLSRRQFLKAVSALAIAAAMPPLLPGDTKQLEEDLSAHGLTLNDLVTSIDTYEMLLKETGVQYDGPIQEGEVGTLFG